MLAGYRNLDRKSLREILIVGNWKMNTSVSEARDLASSMIKGASGINGVTRVICPPFTSLALLSEIFNGTGIRVGAQNLHYEDHGAYTGEISASMLAELCEYVIVGHSERRLFFKETDDMISNKLGAAIKVGLKPILCVGETAEQRDEEIAGDIVRSQIERGLGDVQVGKDLVVAYEPVWAIGTGKVANPTDAQSMMSLIRRIISESCGEASALSVCLLYGGSVKADNVANFVEQPDVDGVLVGGASLKAHSFMELVSNAAKVVGQ